MHVVVALGLPARRRIYHTARSSLHSTPRANVRASAAEDAELGAEEKKENEWKSKLEGVMDDKTFHTTTPAGQQQLFAELELMAFLEEKKLRARKNDAWGASFLPLDGLLRPTGGDEYFFVVRVYDVGVITWPAVRVAVNLWGYDFSASSLKWRFAFDLRDYEEIPLEVAAPLRLQLEDRSARIQHPWHAHILIAHAYLSCFM